MLVSTDEWSFLLMMMRVHQWPWFLLVVQLDVHQLREPSADGIVIREDITRVSHYRLRL